MATACTDCMYNCGAYHPHLVPGYVCDDCKQIPQKLASSIKQIIHNRMLLFAGFIRMEMPISNDLSNDDVKDICHHSIHSLCNIY